MQRSLACRAWARSQIGVGATSAAGTCQLPPKPMALLLPNQYRQAPKFTFATLGTSGPRVKPGPASFKTCFALTPTIPFPRSYRSGPPKQPKPSTPEAQPRASAADVGPAIADVDSSRDTLFAACADGSATEQQVLLAFAACSKAVSPSGALAAAMPRPHSPSESDTAASSLLDLDGSVAGLTQRLAPKVSESSTPSVLINHVSEVALEILAHPHVVITPKVLEAYIAIQASLGKPESLPYALNLYTSRSRPNGGQDSNVVGHNLIEKALDAAIEAKNMDAAVGIIENTYATSAYRKQKVLRKALIPLSFALVAPWAIHLVASQLAHFQSSFTHKTATAMATVGIVAYVGFTGSLGLLAILTHNDQMRRVTWAPGIPLRERWLKEEERAALDKVACSFGFSQSQRFGEEEGPEFEALRQWVLSRGMIMDRVELMEGMS